MSMDIYGQLTLMSIVNCFDVVLMSIVNRQLFWCLWLFLPPFHVVQISEDSPDLATLYHNTTQLVTVNMAALSLHLERNALSTLMAVASSLHHKLDLLSTDTSSAGTISSPLNQLKDVSKKKKNKKNNK